MAARKKFSPALMAYGKDRYERGDPIAEIAADLGIHERTLTRLAKREGWSRRSRYPQRDLTTAMRLFEQTQAMAAEAGLGEPVAADAAEPDVFDPAPDLLGKSDPPIEAAAGAHLARALHNLSSRPSDPGLEPGEREPGPINPGTFEHIANARDTWVPALPRLKAGVGRDDTEVGKAPPAAEGKDPAALDRMERAVLNELAVVERMRAQLGAEPQKPIDAQQTARTLALLTQTLHTLARMRRGNAPTAGFDDDDMPRDIDEFRRAFARRIRVFVESRAGGEVCGGGQPAGHDPGRP